MIGVYKIINILNGDYYVGSSIDLLKRFSAHRKMLRKGNHHSIKLQRAVDKYGLDSFYFVIVEVCSIDDMLNLEQKYINSGCTYNVSLSAGCPMLGRKHNESTKDKFRKRAYPKGQECYQFGKKWSSELREKILSARIGQKRSDEFKESQRQRAIQGNYCERIKDASKIKVIDDLGNVYESLTEAAKKNGVSNQTVCDILKGRHYKTRKGRSFKYYDEI